MTPAELFGALFTYWIASDIVCLLVLRLFDPQDRARARDVFFLTRGAGPLVISWLLFHFLLLLPAQAPSVYLGLMAACFAVALFFGRARLGQLRSIYRDVAAGVWRQWPRSGLPALLAILVAAIGLFIVVVGVTFPIVEGDGLGFAEEARLIHRDLSFENYPTVHADEQTGYHFDTFQIPCLQSLYVWFFLLTGSSDVDILPRTVAPIYGLYCVLVLCWVLYRRTRSVETALWGGLALIAVPLFTAESYYNTQDPHRLYSFFCALVWFDVVLESKAKAKALLLGVFTGLAVYSHFAGLMLLPVILSLYVWFGRATPRRALAAATIGLVALIVGGTHHYLRPAVVERLLLQFPVLQPVVAQPLASLGLDRLLPPKTMVVSPQAYDWLASRRGHQGWLDWLFYAKLQLFTGVEFFGVAAWLATAGIFLMLQRTRRTRLDLILGVAAIACTVFVLSDIRKMASSNPRYIGTILPIVGYFAAMSMAAVTCALRRRAPAPVWMTATALLVLLLVGPVAVNVAVRGAKVGLNNSASVYELVRNASWGGIRRSRPAQTERTDWQRYLGIRQTVNYFFASDATKLMHTHDTFAAINYMRTSTPKSASALVFRVTRYFYYAQRRGIAYTDPRLEGLKKLKTPEGACRFLANLGVDHVLMDSYYETYPMYADTQLENLLSDPVFSTKVYKHGSAEVFALHCSRGLRPATALPPTSPQMPFSRKRRIGG